MSTISPCVSADSSPAGPPTNPRWPNRGYSATEEPPVRLVLKYAGQYVRNEEVVAVEKSVTAGNTT